MIGYYGEYSNSTCQECHQSCKECNGPLENNNTKCKDGIFGICYNECPEGKYQFKYLINFKFININLGLEGN